MVLFGGVIQPSIFGMPTYRGDTWEFDGSRWTQVAIGGPQPSARVTNMVYDTVRNKVVMFGGYGDTAPQTYLDTWEYDGTTWTQRTTATTPPWRASYVSAFDARRGKVVLHSGYLLGTQTPMVTWEFDGNDWAPGSFPGTAPAFPDPDMTFDSRRGTVVLVGASYLAHAETWEYDGTSWRPLANAQIPSIGLAGHTVAYDPQRDALVVFGGEKNDGSWIVPSDETWQFGRFAKATSYGSGCAVTGPQPALTALANNPPQLGATMIAEVANLPTGALPLLLVGTSDTSWNGTPLPMDLQTFGLPGCSLRTSIDQVVLLSNPNGTAQWQLAVPLSPQLQGAVAFGQVALFDAGLQATAVTNGLAVQVGL